MHLVLIESFQMLCCMFYKIHIFPQNFSICHECFGHSLSCQMIAIKCHCHLLKALVCHLQKIGIVLSRTLSNFHWFLSLVGHWMLLLQNYCYELHFSLLSNNISFLCSTSNARIIAFDLFILMMNWLLWWLIDLTYWCLQENCKCCLKCSFLQWCLYFIWMLVFSWW